MLDSKFDRGNAVLLPPLSILNVTRKPFFSGSYSLSAANHLHIGEAVLEVVAANQVAVGFDPVRIVDVVCCRGSSANSIRGS